MGELAKRIAAQKTNISGALAPIPEQEVPFSEIAPYISKLESKDDSLAVNSTHNTNGTQDTGLFQINDVHFTDDGSQLYRENMQALKEAGIAPEGLTLDGWREAMKRGSINRKVAENIYRYKGPNAWSTGGKALSDYRAANPQKLNLILAGPGGTARTSPIRMTQAPASSTGQGTLKSGVRSESRLTPEEQIDLRARTGFGLDSGSKQQITEYLKERLGKDKEGRSRVQYVYSTDRIMINTAKDGQPQKWEPLDAMGGVLGDIVGNGVPLIAPMAATWYADKLVPPGPWKAPAIGLALGAAKAVNKAVGYGLLGPNPQATVLSEAADVGAEIALGAAGQKLGEKIVEKGKKLIAPYRDVTNMKRLEASRGLGIEPLPSEVSSGHFPEIVDEFLENSVGGNVVYKRFRAGRLPQANKLIDEEVKAIGTPSSTYSSTGEALLNAVDALHTRRIGKESERLLGVKDRLYNKVYELADKKLSKLRVPTGKAPGEMMDVRHPINVREFKLDMQKLYGKEISPLEGALPESFSEKSLLGKEIRDLTNLPPEADLQTLLKVRHSIEAAGQTDKLIGNDAVRIAARATDAIDKAIEKSLKASGAEDVLQALRKADRYYGQAKDFFNKGLIARIAQSDPEQIALLLEKPNSAVNARTIKKVLAGTDPELWKTMKANTVRRLFEKVETVSARGQDRQANTQLFAKWRDWGKETKEAIFTPDEIKVLDDMVDTFTHIPIGPGPTGISGKQMFLTKAATTGAMMAAGAGGVGYVASGDLWIAGLVGLAGFALLPATAAKMALSTRGRQFLTEGLQLSKNTKASARRIVEYGTRLSAYLAAPEFSDDRAEFARRNRAIEVLQGVGRDISAPSIDAFLKQNPNF